MPRYVDLSICLGWHNCQIRSEIYRCDKHWSIGAIACEAENKNTGLGVWAGCVFQRGIYEWHLNIKIITRNNWARNYYYFFLPFCFFSVDLTGQSAVLNCAPPAPNHLPWWWMSSCSVTGLRRNSGTISSTSAYVFFLSLSFVRSIKFDSLPVKNLFPTE